MAERTIVKPLSGSEIVDSICATIKRQLSRDCYLTPHLAYPSFSFQADIRVQFQNTGTAIKETRSVSNGQGGHVDSELEMQGIDVTASAEPKGPNEVRVEAGIGVPVLATKPTGGLEEKRVKYAASAGKPKTTTRKALEGRG